MITFKYKRGQKFVDKRSDTGLVWVIKDKFKDKMWSTGKRYELKARDKNGGLYSSKVAESDLDNLYIEVNDEEVANILFEKGKLK